MGNDFRDAHLHVLRLQRLGGAAGGGHGNLFRSAARRRRHRRGGLRCRVCCRRVDGKHVGERLDSGVSGLSGGPGVPYLVADGGGLVAKVNGVPGKGVVEVGEGLLDPVELVTQAGQG